MTDHSVYFVEPARSLDSLLIRVPIVPTIGTARCAYCVTSTDGITCANRTRHLAFVPFWYRFVPFWYWHVRSYSNGIAHTNHARRNRTANRHRYGVTYTDSF